MLSIKNLKQKNCIIKLNINKLIKKKKINEQLPLELQTHLTSLLSYYSAC